MIYHNNIDVIPAILPHSLEEFKKSFTKIKDLSSFIQLDVVERSLMSNSRETFAFEGHTVEFDLMTDDSLRDARKALSFGATRIVVHSDFPNAKEAIEFLQPSRTTHSIEVGVALPSTATPEMLKQFEGQYDYVQVMGIEHVGSQGQPFDLRSLALVSVLRKEYPNLFIQIDGAAAGHVRECVAVGVNRLIVGSALLSAEDPKEVYKQLYTEANRS